MFGIGRQGTLVGLDIGSNSVKAVELKRSKQGWELAACGLVRLAPGAAAEGAIRDRAAVAEAIQELLAEQKIKTREVATSVSGHSVIVKRISLPRMSEEELFERMRVEAAQHISFDIAEMNLSYQVLEGESANGQMNVLLVAAKKEKVQMYTEVVSQAGKTARVVDIDAFALENCFEANYSPESNQTVALLNIGASVLNIDIVRDEQPLFTRDVSIGGNDYTEALEKEFGLGFPEAERLKRGEAVPGSVPERLQAALRSVSQTLILEILKTFDFFRATAPDANIERLYVAGGAARLPGLLKLLQQECSVPAEELDPFRRISVRPRKQEEERVRELAPQLAIAVGLALRSFEAT